MLSAEGDNAACYQEAAENHNLRIVAFPHTCTSSITNGKSQPDFLDGGDRSRAGEQGTGKHDDRPEETRTTVVEYHRIADNGPLARRDPLAARLRRRVEKTLETRREALATLFAQGSGKGKRGGHKGSRQANRKAVIYGGRGRGKGRPREGRPGEGPECRSANVGVPQGSQAKRSAIGAIAEVKVFV